MKPSEIIDKALTEVIPDESKWCQQTRRNEYGQYCMVGALAMAHHGFSHNLQGDLGTYLEPEEELVRRAIHEAIHELPDHKIASTITYNDAMTRTYDEVRAVMEKARAGLQEKGL